MGEQQSLLPAKEQAQIDLHACQEAERRAAEAVRRAHRNLDIAKHATERALRQWHEAHGTTMYSQHVVPYEQILDPKEYYG